MMRRQRIHEENNKENTSYTKLQSNETVKSEKLPSDTNTTNIRENTEIPQNNITMATTVKMEIRRTVMTPRGRKFPPREPVIFDLPLPFPAKTGGQTTGDEFKVLSERVAAAFPKMQAPFTFLRKGDDGTLVPCDTHTELLKALEGAGDNTAQLYVQGQSNWGKHGADQVQCTNCTTTIPDMRVKCLECDEYNLCPRCHDLGNHGHHVMVRCDRPRFFHMALPLFAESLPKLCRDVREKNSGDKLPTLEPREVRQFWQKERKNQDENTQQPDVAGAKRKASEQEKPGFRKHACGQGHSAAKCTNCSATIEGMRVKCLECNDFTLCPLCDEQGIHGDHVMVKCDRARFFLFALPVFAEALPKLCKEVRDKHVGENMPRLEPKEVRQFCQRERRPKDDVKQQGDNGATTAEKQQRPVLKMTMCGQNQPEVQCNNCCTTIQGMRLKCLQCDDFYLCPQCDDKGIHGDHVMVKSDRPRFFKFGLPHFAGVIPELCEKWKINHAGGPIPRLMREDLLHFARQGKNQECDEQKEKRLERRQQMRKTWLKFLREIAAENEDVSAGDWEMVSDGEKQKDDKAAEVDNSDQEELAMNAQSMDLGESSAQFDKDTMEKLQQMKSQWMQKCHEEWRGQLSQVDKPEQMDRQFQFRMWRPYMRRCWDLWRQQLTEADMKPAKLSATEKEMQRGRAEGGKCHHEGHRGFCHPRRRWIHHCWQLWRDEASKNANNWIPVDPMDAEGATQEKPRRGPFPGYHFLMTKSWRLMLDQTKPTRRHHRSLDESINKDAADPAEEFQPGMGKHILKRCWVNGSRELWWMHARKLLNIPEVGANDSTVGEEFDKVSQQDVMKLMSAKPNWRSYVQQCWSLGHQLSKQAGLIIKHEQSPETDQKSSETESVKPLNPRQAWIGTCWPQWNEEMNKAHDLEQKRRPRDDKDGKPMWNKRPFAGWHPLITRSWQLMNAHNEGNEQNRKEVKMEQIRSMRAAWMKEVQREMEQLSLKKKEGMDANDEHPRAGTQDDVVKPSLRAGPQDDGGDLAGADGHGYDHPTFRNPTPNQQWPKNVDLQEKLMKQYWHMYSNRHNVQRGDSSQPDECPWKMNRKQRRAEMRRKVSTHGAESDDDDEAEQKEMRLKLRLKMKKASTSQQ